MFSKLTTVVLGACLLSGAAVGAHRFQSEDMMYMPGKTAAYISAYSEGDDEEDIMPSEKAVAIALNHAGLKASDMDDHEIHQRHDIPLDTEVYDIEIWTLDKDYDFTIEAYTGQVLKYEVTNNNQ